MNVILTVLEKDKNALREQLLKTDKERTLATHREADLAKKVRRSFVRPSDISREGLKF